MEKEEFLRMLPRLIMEDNEVKGAIITALSGVVATKEDITRQIEHSDRRFEAIQKQMDERFGAMQKQMDERFEAFQHQLDIGFREIKASIDNLGGRAGKSAEMAVLKLLQEENKLKNLEINKISQIKLKDAEGQIFAKGFTTDVDILMENGKTILIEVKFKVDNRDLQHFFNVAKLYEKLYKKPDELWVLTFEITPKTLKVAELFPFKIIYGRIK